MDWSAENIRRLADLNDAPEIHHGDAVADLLHDREIVSNEQVREPEFLLQVVQKIDDLSLHGHIECGKRLVADDERRLDSQGTRDAETLPLPA